MKSLLLIFLATASLGLSSCASVDAVSFGPKGVTVGPVTVGGNADGEIVVSVKVPSNPDS